MKNYDGKTRVGERKKLLTFIEPGQGERDILFHARIMGTRPYS